MRRTIATALLLGLALAGCAPTDDSETTDTTTGTTTGGATTESTDTPTTEPGDDTTTEPTEASGGEAGTRDNPLAIGTTAIVGDYEVTLDEFVRDANDQMASANQFNDPAENGQYGLVTLTVTYQGDEEGEPAFDLAVTMVGGNAVQYSDTDCFATEPNPMTEAPTLERGGTYTGQLCLDFPPEALDGSILFVEPLFSFDDADRRWWATS